MQQATSARLAVVATSTATNIGTIALADQLNRLRARVALSEGDVARATEVDEATVRQWVERKAVPMGVHANRLAELIAVVEEMALNIQPDGISEWLVSEVPALGGEVPADVIASGGYQRVMDIALWLSAGGFT
jgi:DNA-binding transcriptional regulator YiaG